MFDPYDHVPKYLATVEELADLYQCDARTLWRHLERAGIEPVEGARFDARIVNLYVLENNLVPISRMFP